MEIPASLERKRAILEYWTLVEFFSPYILENAINPKQSLQKIYAEDNSIEPLPWLEAAVIDENDPVTPFAKGYHLYLGLFNFEEIADRARHVFAQSRSEWQSINWRITGAANSTTCFARLTVSTHGIPLFGTLTLSTLPWAHGNLLLVNEKSLKIEQYWKSVNRLLQKIYENFSTQLPAKLVKKPKTTASYFDQDSLFKFSELLFQWAGYKPQGYPIALIEPITNSNSTISGDSKLKTERDVPILNSFYIQDLESATISLAAHKGSPIDHYLDENHEMRILLESDEGAKNILDILRPEKIPSGRWPDSLSQQQSLMQQFAINATFDADRIKNLISVNGPPGTGKTSLLRDVIAEKVVARADALSKFPAAHDAFTGRQALNFENGDLIYVSELDPSLLGYEMLVVSSNNTAIQNLSQELPLRSKLDSSFHSASYLETVACKVLGLNAGEAWGLISATLGNSGNCRNFVENVFITQEDVNGHTRIWEWLDNYKGPSFREAKEHFIAIKRYQEELFGELEILAMLHDEVGDISIECFCSKELEALMQSEQLLEQIKSKYSHHLKEEAETKELLSILQERKLLWEDERPSILKQILYKTTFKAWSEKSKQFKKEHLEELEELKRIKAEQKNLNHQLAAQENEVDEMSKQLLDRSLFFHLHFDHYERLRQRHPSSRLPHGIDELKEVVAHTQSYYLTHEINKVRSELFIAAMHLHQAWLAETSQSRKGFRGNLMAIAHILQGKTPTTANDTRIAWQSAFLLIPVISSTFASIGRLFRYLEPGTLGLLLIDEAGQAAPQAAVGAIWRSKMVLSIGDPFQIEPICPIPSEVIDGMAKSYIEDNILSWAPSQVSVQHLMDRATVFGTKRTIQEENYWLGSPLRVHRRCLEPMFTIANSIAYENNMLFATTSNGELSLPPSCWWDVGGHTTIKQYVPEQGAALVSLIKEAMNKLDNPDIYIISPFREIIHQLQKLLLDNKSFNNLFNEKFPTVSLSSWIKQSIGTVHTFQGKQAAAVFFVLGADKSTLGAIEWASRRPNLLNVAVTRAQSRFYIIGDYNLWKSWPYFDVAAKQLMRNKYVRKDNNTRYTARD